MQVHALAPFDLTQALNPARTQRQEGVSSAASQDPVGEAPVREEDVLAVRQAQEDGESQASGDELAHQARMQVVRDYIETCGAPEEKDQEELAKTFWQRLQEQDDEKRGQGLPGNALNTWANVIQDPEDQGRMHVYTVKTDAEGKAKITRHVKFDSGDGEDRSQLTAERAKAAKAYARQSADGENGHANADHKKDKQDDEA